MSSSPGMSIKKYPGTSCSVKINGEALEYNNQEDGFIMNSTNLNHISYSSEDPLELTLKLDFHQLDSSHHLILSYMYDHTYIADNSYTLIIIKIL